MQRAWLCIFVLTVSIAHGQTLTDLLQKAERSYPFLKSKTFERLAAQDQVASAKNSVIPNLDAAYQLNYATYNNITGMASPQYFVPISGPPSSGNTYDPMFGSVASLLMSWDVFTFGQRSARTGIAKANLEVAEADAEYEIFKHKINVIQTYLDLLYAHELLKVYQKNLERSQERTNEIQVLTQTGLRPSVDSTLFAAELSKAKIELLSTQKLLEGQELVLAELIGGSTIAFTADTTFFSKLPTLNSDTASSDHHPLISLSRARVSLFSAWSAIAFPASMSLITESLGYSKTAMGISMHSIIRRIPMAVGPILGGLLITQFGLIKGIKISFVISILLCLIGIVFQFFIKEKPQQYKKIHPVALYRQMDVRLKNLLLSDVLIRFCEQIPFVFVVIWCLNIVKISPAEFGILTAIEMMTAALVYIPVASFSDKLERKPFVVITFIFFTLFPVTLFFSKTFFALVIAFVIRGLKEFGEPTRKAIILDLSTSESKARGFGLYYFIRDTIVSFAAFLGGWIWMKSPAANLFVATAFGVAGTIVYLVYGKSVQKKLN